MSLSKILIRSPVHLRLCPGQRGWCRGQEGGEGGRESGGEGAVGVAGGVEAEPRPRQQLTRRPQRVGGVPRRAAHHQVRGAASGRGDRGLRRQG